MVRASASRARSTGRVERVPPETRAPHAAASKRQRGSREVSGFIRPASMSVCRAAALRGH